MQFLPLHGSFRPSGVISQAPLLKRTPLKLKAHPQPAHFTRQLLAYCTRPSLCQLCCSVEGALFPQLSQDLLTKLGSDVTPHEVITLVRQLGADQQGLVVDQLLAALKLAPPPPTPPPEPVHQARQCGRAAYG